MEQAAGVEAVFTYPMDETGAVGEAFGVSAPLAIWSSVFDPCDEAVRPIGMISQGLTPAFPLSLSGLTAAAGLLC